MSATRFTGPAALADAMAALAARPAPCDLTPVIVPARPPAPSRVIVRRDRHGRAIGREIRPAIIRPRPVPTTR